MMDVQVDAVNRIWVLDNTNSRITIFESPGHWTILDLRESVSRVVPMDSRRYILKKRFSETPELWHMDGSRIRSFEPLVRDPLLWSYIHDGFLEKDPEGGIVRNLFYTHSFVRYTNDGEIDYFRRGIHPPAMTEIMENIDEPRRYSEDQELFFREISPFSRLPRFSSFNIHHHEIHTLPSFPTDEVRMSFPEGDIYYFERRFVDVYDLETGDYLYSYKLPEPVTDIAISGKFVVGILENTPGMVIWKMD